MTQDQVNLDGLIENVQLIDNKIFELNKTIAPQLAELNEAKRKAQATLDAHVSQLAAQELKDKDYGCGTANIETALYKIKAVVSKKVKWDEGKLREVANQIRSAGQDPEAYIKYKLSVSETDYKKFPEAIQKAFVPARTVEPSDPKITIERK